MSDKTTQKQTSAEEALAILNEAYAYYTPQPRIVPAAVAADTGYDDVEYYAAA